MPPFPSRRRVFGVHDLYSLIRDPSALIASKVLARLRTVAVRSNNDNWYNFATVVRIEPLESSTNSKQHIDLDSVVLFEVSVLPASWKEPEDFERFLAAWRQEVGISHGFHFEIPLRPERLFKNNRWQPMPGWLFQLREKVDDQSNYGSPEGPFLDGPRGIYAKSVGQLAALWLGSPSYQNDSTIRHEYRVLVPDLRAVIDTLKATDNELDIGISTLGSRELYAAVSSEDFRGQQHVTVRRVEDGHAIVAFPGSVRSMEITVASDDGEPLDLYSEDQYSVSWGPSLYNQPRELYDAAFGALRAALKSGESIHVEFKPFIRGIRGDEKAMEIVQTVAAFANTEGGDLFFGVSDLIEPKGILIDLRRTYAPECSGDITRMQDAYVRDLRKLLTDSLGVSVHVDYQWIDFAQDMILQATVRQATAKPVALAANGEIYVRTGANNRTIRQADIGMQFRSSTHGIPFA